MSSLAAIIVGAEFSDSRHVKVDVSLAFTSVTWNTVATHTVLSITGTAVRVRILIECTGSLTSAGAATICFGVTGATAAFIADTTATDIDDDEFWFSTTPAGYLILSGKSTTPGVFIDAVVHGSLDVGYEIKTAALTSGGLTFTCWWEPINNGSLVAGAGGVL